MAGFRALVGASLLGGLALAGVGDVSAQLVPRAPEEGTGVEVELVVPLIDDEFYLPYTSVWSGRVVHPVGDGWWFTADATVSLAGEGERTYGTICCGPVTDPKATHIRIGAPEIGVLYSASSTFTLVASTALPGSASFVDDEESEAEDAGLAAIPLRPERFADNGTSVNVGARALVAPGSSVQLGADALLSAIRFDSSDGFGWWLRYGVDVGWVRGSGGVRFGLGAIYLLQDEMAFPFEVPHDYGSRAQHEARVEIQPGNRIAVSGRILLDTVLEGDSFSLNGGRFAHPDFARVNLGLRMRI